MKIVLYSTKILIFSTKQLDLFEECDVFMFLMISELEFYIYKNILFSQSTGSVPYIITFMQSFALYIGLPRSYLMVNNDKLFNIFLKSSHTINIEIELNAYLIV